MCQPLKLRDDKTNQVFDVDPVKVREFVVTRDGVRVKLYPNMIKLSVGRNEKVDGQTAFGPRSMTRIS